MPSTRPRRPTVGKPSVLPAPGFPCSVPEAKTAAAPFPASRSRRREQHLVAIRGRGELVLQPQLRGEAALDEGGGQRGAAGDGVGAAERSARLADHGNGARRRRHHGRRGGRGGRGRRRRGSRRRRDEEGERERRRLERVGARLVERPVTPLRERLGRCAIERDGELRRTFELDLDRRACLALERARAVARAALHADRHQLQHAHRPRAGRRGPCRRSPRRAPGTRRDRAAAPRPSRAASD